MSNRERVKCSCTVCVYELKINSIASRAADRIRGEKAGLGRVVTLYNGIGLKSTLELEEWSLRFDLFSLGVDYVGCSLQLSSNFGKGGHFVRDRNSTIFSSILTHAPSEINALWQ